MKAVRHGLFVVSGLGAVLCMLACEAEKKELDQHQLSRMAETRDHLKTELGDQYDRPIGPGTDEQIERGRILYKQLCAPCHGARGDVSGHVAEGLLVKPADLTDAELSRFYSEQARLHIIRKGIAGTPMMGWQTVLPENDILSVYVYIRTLIERE